MAIAFVGSAGVSTTIQTQSVTVPAAVQEGDLLLVAQVSVSSATFTSLSGYTKVDERTSNGRFVLWSKVATATDAGSVHQFRLSSTSRHAVVMVAYRDATIAASAARTGAGSTITAETVTPTVETLAVGVFCHWIFNTGGFVNTPDTPLVERIRVSPAGSFSSGSASVAVGEYPTPQPAGTFAAGTAGCYASGAWCGWSLALADTNPPSGGAASMTWWDGAVSQPTEVVGWWDGTASQSVEVVGWWDSAASQPLA